MSRNHGRIMASIWEDTDFRALSSQAQRTYLLLVSQPTLTHLGVMPFTVRRWSNGCDQTTPEDMLAELRELSAARFVVVDPDTDELLVRSLMRNDDVMKQPRVLQSAVSTAATVSSQRIRLALLLEVDRCADEGVSEAAAPILKRLRETLAAGVSDTPGHTPADTPSQGLRETKETPADTPAEGYAQGSHSRAGVPLPLPLPLPLPPPAGAANGDPEPDTAHTLLDEWIRRHPKRPPDRVVGKCATAVASLLAEPWSAADIRAGLALLAEKGLDPSVLPSLVNQAANAPPRPSRTAAREPHAWTGPPPTTIEEYLQT